MNDESVGIHWSFWVIGVVALIWNAMGAMNFFMQMNPESNASFPESHRTIIENRPPWATASFAISVFGGVLGCILLLLKLSAAIIVFIVSLIAIIATTAHAFSITGSPFQSSMFDVILTVISPILLAVFLVWYSKNADAKGWLR
jgi:hypothetical protein